MKNFLFKIFAVFLLALSLFSFVNIDKTRVVAEDNLYTVTFDYNIGRIISYIPPNDSLLKSLSTYAVEVEEGKKVTEAPKPMSQLSMYYSYEWTYNNEVISLSDLVVTENTTLVAKWTPREYTVYFNFETDEIRNSVTNLVDTMTYNIESPRLDLYKPNRPGFVFQGWFDGVIPIDYLYIPEGSVGDKVYTAKFLPITYTINYRTNNSNNPNPSTYEINDEDILLNSPYKAGHIFKGWFLDKDYQNEVKIIDCSIGGNINLFAKWELEKYKVTYVLPGDNQKTETITVEYGKKAELPKLNKSIFQLAVTDVSRNNITEDTTIHIKLVNIWYLYVLAILLIVAVILTIIFIRKKRNYTHNKLRQVYQSNISRKKRKN